MQSIVTGSSSPLFLQNLATAAGAGLDLAILCDTSRPPPHELLLLPIFNQLCQQLKFFFSLESFLFHYAGHFFSYVLVTFLRE